MRMGRTNTSVPDVFDFFTLHEARREGSRISDCPEARQEKTRQCRPCFCTSTFISWVRVRVRVEVMYRVRIRVRIRVRVRD